MKISHARFVSLLAMVSVASLFAQTSALPRTLLLAMAANAKRIVQYEWKQRITIVRNGRPAEPVIDKVSFDSSGEMRRTTISAPPQMSGLRGRIAAKTRENVKEIMGLAGQYNKPMQMATAIKKAQITETSSASTIRVQASDLIKPGDGMTMLVNSTTHLAKHVDIHTNYDGAPMTIAQEYEQLPGGPNVMKSMNVAVPQKDLTVNVTSYEFTQQTAREK